MTKRVLDYDPLSGVTTFFEYTSDDQMVITHSQDVSGVLDTNHAMRVDEDYSRNGIKNDQWHYARVPDAVQMEMLQKYGVNMITPPIDWKSVLHCINKNYPYLKVTEKTHA